jgi:hypothetical protein
MSRRAVYLALATVLALALIPSVSFAQVMGTDSGQSATAPIVPPDLVALQSLPDQSGICFVDAHNTIRYSMVWNRSDLIDRLAHGAVLVDTSWDCGFVTTGPGGRLMLAGSGAAGLGGSTGGGAFPSPGGTMLGTGVTGGSTTSSGIGTTTTNTSGSTMGGSTGTSVAGTTSTGAASGGTTGSQSGAVMGSGAQSSSMTSIGGTTSTSGSR